MTAQTEDDDSHGTDLDGLLRQYEAGLAASQPAGADDIEALVEERQALARKLGLGRRVLRVYDEVKFVSPGRRPHLKRLGCVVRSREVKGAERATVVQLDLRGRAYALTFREPPASHEEVLAYLDVQPRDGPVVFTVLLKFDINEPGDGWMPGEVEAFVPGTWVKDFIELSINLDSTAEPHANSPTEPERDSLKKKFGL